MQRRQTIIILLSFLLTLNSDGQDFFDYNIDSKNSLVFFAVQRYDSSSQKAIDAKTTTIAIDENSKLLSKKDKTLLRQLMTDTLLRSDKSAEEYCNGFYATKVFVIFIDGNIVARIMIACDNKVMLFDPPRKRQTLLESSDFVLSDKGIILKDKLYRRLDAH